MVRKGNGIMRKNILIMFLFIFLILFDISFIFAQLYQGSQYQKIDSHGPNYNSRGYSSYNPSLNTQYFDPSFFSSNSYSSEVFGSYDSTNCAEQQDFILEIIPEGCTPSFIRSDLLEEQNVPVFCKVILVQNNPFIDISNIRNLKFRGSYPKGISGVSFFPSRAALTNGLENSQVRDDFGYLVITVSRFSSEKSMPDFIQGDIHAVVDYDVRDALGISETNLYVSETKDFEWERDYKQYSFWNGKGYVRVNSIDSNKAVISVYEGDLEKTSLTLKKGETSKDIYLSGPYCSGGMNIRLEDIGAPVNSALLQINNEKVWVAEGDKILNNKCRVADLDVYEKGGKISIACPVKDGRFDLILSAKDNGVNFTDKDWSFENLSEKDTLALEYYDRSIENYEDLVDFYPTERMLNGFGDPYAARGLYEAARLSRVFGMNRKFDELSNRLINEYPDSESANWANFERELIGGYDLTNSMRSITINSRQYSVGLLSFKKPKSSELSAVLLIDGKEETLGLNDVAKLNKNSLKIEDIREGFVVVRYFGEDSKAEKLSLKESKDFEGVNVKLDYINLDRQAKLKIIPKNSGPRAEINFGVLIDIDKRDIKLAPEQTRFLIGVIEDTIALWESISNNLWTVMKGLKASCLATSSLITIKNSVTGVNPDSISRNDLMTDSGGWNEYCEEQVNQKKYVSIAACLLDKSKEVDKDVKIYSDEIKKTDKIIEEIRGSGKNQKDQKAVEEEFKKRFDAFCKNAEGSVKISGKSVSFGEKGEICNWESMTHEQRKEIMTLYNTKNSGSDVLQNMASRKLNSAVLEVENQEQGSVINIDSDKNERDYNLGINTVVPIGDVISRGDVKTINAGDLGHDIYGNYNQGDSVVRIFIPVKKNFGGVEFVANSEVAGKEVIVQVKKEGNNYVPNGGIYSLAGNQITGDAEKSVKDYMSLAGLDKIKKADKSAYENPIKNPELLRVKYFEKAPYKGLPSEVPFDVENGWYAEMTYVLSGFGRPYDESGRVTNLYICNVGENGLIEFKKGADDICRYYNRETGADVIFPGLTRDESVKLVGEAERAIEQAIKQYGKDKININGRNFEKGSSFGGGEGRCTDFMSPTDCNLLFNVCDPVICPSSRCDFGGKYRVNNVAGTGIVGSMLLCLPNYREGIAIPICLTGVNTGIDNYLSVLKSTRDCLKESLTSGRHVGICDEIKSVYLCELFWKESNSLMNILSPNSLSGFAFLNGMTTSRGGGEYLNVNSALQNTENAVSYVLDEYAGESSRAFLSRSIEGIGLNFCQSFIYSGSPRQEDLLSGSGLSTFEKLIEPESPVQYNAWFSESPFTSITVPSTSHYKVYYHIYAGRNRGSQYVVSLRGVSDFGTSGQTYVVDRGYVALGSQVDKARDFTAPSGYTQLCISINGEEKCGFGKVSTSGSGNLVDSYIEEELEAEIRTEKECVSGMTSSTGNPSVYKRGVLRVCSTDNPGKQISSGDSSESYRWKEVGYCGDESIKCWLDTNSIENSIKDSGVIVDEITSDSIDNIDFWTEEMSRSVAEQADKFISELSISSETDVRGNIERKTSNLILDLNKLTELGINNNYRARGFYLLGSLYRRIAENFRPETEVIVDYQTYEGSVNIENGDVEDGLGVIVDSKTYEGEFGFSDIIFEFKDGTFLADINYRYENGWKWLSEGTWISVSENEIGELSLKNQAFVKSLRGKSCDEGLKLLVSRVLRDDEGNILTNPSLVIHVDDKSREFEYHSGIGCSGLKDFV